MVDRSEIHATQISPSTAKLLGTIQDQDTIVMTKEWHKFIAPYRKFLSDINLELRNFFAANMSAALGGILDLFISDLNDIHFDYISPEVETILQKNDFLSYYGKTRIPDTFRTTIKFQKIKPSDGRYFKNYVIQGQFPGTIVNLQLRTDDQKSYKLKREIDINTIF